MYCLFSSKHSSEDKQHTHAKITASQFPIFPLYSPSSFNLIRISPFHRQPLNLNPNFQFLMETSKAVCEFQKSIVSNVERCLNMLDNFRSRNGVLDKVVLNLSSYLQNRCRPQLPSGNPKNLAMSSNSNFASILPGDSVSGTVITDGISSFLDIYNSLLVARLVFTWFPTAPRAVVSPLGCSNNAISFSTLCDPYLNIFRGLIPPLGGLDLSSILAFLVLNPFSSTAAALPAELPSTEGGSQGTQSPTAAARLTMSRNKWVRRFAGNKSRISEDEI
ncbi:hypothetical protein OROGR_027193 [Orobanche gracilis]